MALRGAVIAAAIAVATGCRTDPPQRHATAVAAAHSQSATLDSAAAHPGADGLSADPAAASFVGRTRCTGCHAEEARAWEHSHHDQSMQIASADTVLGDFTGASFQHGHVTTRWYRRDDAFLVHTDGPDGAMHEYQVAYTLGVAPLQQYLVALPGGRLQVLPIAWDSRPAAQGGQRWFHLYPNDPVTHDHPLHWTQRSQNWNDRCADCHSTNLRKGYRPDDDGYDTTWSELDVSCEACHGPGSLHVARARAQRPVDELRSSLAVRFGDGEPAPWMFDGARPIARRSRPRTSHAEVEACAPCHARRAEIADGTVPGRAFLDDYLPSLLVPSLYFADGQIDGEVYEYGSFLQSAMYRAGVTCSDCHDPHSLRLRADGNALCTRCHQAATYDQGEHHLHATNSAGAQCVACHMPARTYMQIDERRDHGLRVPRPDLAGQTGAPDACGACHRDRSPAWAAQQIAARHGPRRTGTQSFGPTIAAARRHDRGAIAAAVDLAGDTAAPAIARATAMSLLRGSENPAAAHAIRAAADSPDALLRLAAVEVAATWPPPAIADVLGPRLSDPLRAVRLAAASALAAVPAATVGDQFGGRLAQALEEYRSAQHANLDRADAHLNLSVLALNQARPDEAQRELETAIRLDPYFAPAYVNLADVFRLRRRDADAERVLRQGLARLPDDADVHHALGLALVRRHQADAALAELEAATRLAPDTGRFAYVLGVAFHSTGHTAKSLAVLRTAHQRHSGDTDVLLALATISRDAGDRDASRDYARQLAELAPWDPQALRLVVELDAR